MGRPVYRPTGRRINTNSALPPTLSEWSVKGSAAYD
jgi:hypothetical protein